MAKWYGTVGYVETKETAPDVWTSDEIVERQYYGDVMKNHSRWESKDQLNDDLRLNNQISILADAYAYQNFHQIKYVTYMGSKWKVTEVEVQTPRLILSIGGVWNG